MNWKEFLKKYKIGIILFVIGLILISILIFNGTTPVNSYIDALEDNNITKADKIYYKSISSNEKLQNKLAEEITEKANKIYDSYSKDSISYEKAVSKLNLLHNSNIGTIQIANTRDKLKQLNTSKTAYNTALDLESKGEIKLAITEYSKVKEIDANYSKAQAKITELASNYKSIILSEINKLISENNYKTALEQVDQGLKILPNDSELLSQKKILTDKRKEFDTSERNKLVEELKNKQEVSVVNTSILEESYKSRVSIIVKNNTNKSVKSFSVGWLCYDSKGYPIKTGYMSKAYLNKGTGELTIEPGKTAGENYGWSTDSDDGINTILACVISVQYYDDTTWNNEYYNYWLEDYLEKPLK